MTRSPRRRGDTTTRERDFADILLTARPGIEASQLAAAIKATASHRGSSLRALRQVLIDLGAIRQRQWEQYVSRSHPGTDLPPTYQQAIAIVADFADPILTGAVTSGWWDQLRRTWRTPDDATE